MVCLFLLLISPLPLYAQDCSDLYPRPELSGEELTREADNFIIHYTDEGADAATEEHIDYIQETLEYVLEFQVDYLGWPLPLTDCGEGGDQRFDIYIYDSLNEDYTGFALPKSAVKPLASGMGI